MSDLKDQLVKLGEEEPELRDNLRSVLGAIDKEARPEDKEITKGLAELTREYHQGLEYLKFGPERMARDLDEKKDIQVNQQYIERNRDKLKEMARELV